MANEAVQSRPMTRYEEAIAGISNPKELKIAYDTLKTDYDRRYFLNALPGYFDDHHITNVPFWVEKAVLDGIKSKDAKYVREAVEVAGVLKLNFSDVLIKLYPSIDSTFGYHADMLKSRIIRSLTVMDNKNKKEFYLKTLQKYDVPHLCETFDALLGAIQAEPDTIYDQNLAGLLSKLESKIAKKEEGSDKDKQFQLSRLIEVRNRIEKSRAKISTGGGK